MLINGVPVKEYGAKQLTVDFTPSTQEKTYEWNAGARLPIMVENRATFKKATILLKVTGGSRQEINKNASHLHKLANTVHIRRVQRLGICRGTGKRADVKENH